MFRRSMPDAESLPRHPRHRPGFQVSRSPAQPERLIRTSRLYQAAHHFLPDRNPVRFPGLSSNRASNPRSSRTNSSDRYRNSSN